MFVVIGTIKYNKRSPEIIKRNDTIDTVIR